jgi:pyruvate dehydrogenase E2 component (dihydrolipoamide acetyltransferase)
MPSLGADMESGRLLEWRVEPGDTVKRGDIVAVIDTSKAEIEVEIFEDGVIDELLVSEGTRVPVGTVLARLRAGGVDGVPATPAVAAEPLATTPATTTPPTGPTETAATAPPPEPTVMGPPPPTPPVAAQQQPPEAHRLRVSPVARRAAEQLGVEVAALAGSGPEGAITKADVERAAAAVAQPAGPAAATAGAGPTAAPAPAPTPPAAAAGEPGDRTAAMRLAIGALMARSKREIPHYYLQTQIDMSRAMAWLEEENLRRSVPDRLLPSALLLSAVAGAVAAMPAMNGSWVDGAFRPADGVHLGVAISLRGGGLIAPALHDADHKSLDELMSGLRDLVTRARTGRLRSSEMSDPTITVTNLGEQGVDLVHGVIYPPQVALVGFGGIRERPWAANGMIGARPVVIATLAADHRASDGHAGSRFLTTIDHRLQEPEEL